MKAAGNFLAFLLSILVPTSLFADKAVNWQMGFQEAVTPVMETIASFHYVLVYIMAGIVVVVMALMIYVMCRFNAKANPIPSTTTHNTFIEILWTLVPVIILMVIGIPSIKLIYFSHEVKEPELTIKAIGHQWYWSYQFPKEDVEFESRIIPDAEIDPSKGQVRLLSVDKPLYLPVNTTIRILTTSEDVLHSWALPAFGVKKDSVPGKLNETWVRVSKEGVYHGQCSELCGMQHGFMPIEIHVVSKEKYDEWMKSHKEKQS